MPIQLRQLIAVSLLLALLIGCQTARPYAAAPPTDEAGVERNHGYALLYSTIESETQVDQVMMVKRPRPEVAELLREIAGFAKAQREQLDALAVADDSLGYDIHGLPYVEAKTRDLITATTTRSIMLSGGKAFEFNILLTQHEALSYIKHLARALHEMDDDPDRQAFLKSLADEAGVLHERVITLMREEPPDATGVEGE